MKLIYVLKDITIIKNLAESKLPNNLFYDLYGFSQKSFFSLKNICRIMLFDFGACRRNTKFCGTLSHTQQSFKMFRTLLRKAVCDRRIFLCGSLVKAFCYTKRSIVKILLRKTAYGVSGLRCFWPPHFLRGAYLCGQYFAI